MKVLRMHWARLKKHLIEYGGMAVALLGLILYFSLTTDRFFTLNNFQTISTQIPAATIVAVGMTYVLLIGAIDLSVGSALALCSAILSVLLLQFGWPLALAIPAAILTGLAIGLVNGAIISRWSLPSFIVTLAMLEAARGLTFMVTQSRTQYVGSRIDAVRDTEVLGLSLMFVAAILIAILGQVILRHTAFGRYVIAVGGNEDVAYLSGIPPKRIKLAVFAACGALVGVASVIHTARLSASDPNTGIGFELEAIAAVVIGGTSLSGGRGSVLRSLFGVLVIAILGSGLAQAGAQEHTKRLITGLVIIFAVILDRYRRTSLA